MATGTNCRLDIDRGFGFISPDGGGKRNVFFHVSGLVGLPFDETLTAKEVAFDLEQTDRGPKAVNVRSAW